MDLNEDATLDLDSAPDYLVLPGDPDATPKEGEGVRVVIGQAAEKGDAVDLLRAVEEHKVELETEEDEISKVHDLDEVVETVLGLETIDQTTAQSVASHLPELEEHVGPLASYTDYATRTNLEQTKRYVKSELSARQAALEERLQKSVKRGTDIVSISEQVLTKLFDRAVKVVEETQCQAIGDMEEVTRSKAFYFASEGGMYDIRKRSFTCFENTLPAPFNDPKFLSSIKMISGIINDASFKPLLRASRRAFDHQEYDEDFAKSYDSKDSYDCNSYDEVLSWLAKGEILQGLSNYGKNLHLLTLRVKEAGQDTSLIDRYREICKLTEILTVVIKNLTSAESAMIYGQIILSTFREHMEKYANG